MSEPMADALRANVVVVDDEPSVTRILKSMLALDGHAVEVCNSGVELMQILEQRTPDLVFLDLNLPGQSGLDILRVLRSRHQDRVAVVILTGESGDAGLNACLAEGAADYLLKPVRLERLLASVRSALTARNLRRQRDASAAELTIARAALAATLAAASEPLVIVDCERRVTAWSEAANGLIPALAHGRAVDELLGSLPRAPDLDERAFAGGAVLVFRGAKSQRGHNQL